jgi:hypothetical protein
MLIFSVPPGDRKLSMVWRGVDCWRLSDAAVSRVLSARTARWQYGADDAEKLRG